LQERLWQAAPPAGFSRSPGRIGLKLKPLHRLAGLGLALAGAVGTTAVGMTIDPARPLLEWINSQKAIKQNLNVVFGLLADMGLLGPVGDLLFRLSAAGVRPAGLVLTAPAALAVLSGLGWRLLMGFAERRYQEIEA